MDYNWIGDWAQSPFYINLNILNNFIIILLIKFILDIKYIQKILNDLIIFLKF